MAGIEKVVTANYIKELVEKRAKTHKEVSEILRQGYPSVEGLSDRSVRRCCATNNIQRHDSGLTIRLSPLHKTNCLKKISKADLLLNLARKL